MHRFERRNYRWLLTADPPLCRAGKPEVVLQKCDRLAKGEECACRLEVQLVADDLEALGWAALAESLDDELEPADINTLACSDPPLNATSGSGLTAAVVPLKLRCSRARPS